MGSPKKLSVGQPIPELTYPEPGVDACLGRIDVLPEAGKGSPAEGGQGKSPAAGGGQEKSPAGGGQAKSPAGGGQEKSPAEGRQEKKWSSATSGASPAASGRTCWMRKSPGACKAPTPASAAAPPGSPKRPSRPARLECSGGDLAIRFADVAATKKSYTGQYLRNLPGRRQRLC